MFGFKFSAKNLPYMEQGKTVYAPLRTGSSSTSDKGDYEDKTIFVSAPVGRSPRFWKFSVILLLIITNISTLAGLFATKHLTDEMKADNALEIHYAPKSWGKLRSIKRVVVVTDRFCSSRGHTTYYMDTAQLVD
jgi:hypothetical protein